MMAGPSLKEFWWCAGQLHKMGFFFLCTSIYDEMLIILMRVTLFTPKQTIAYNFYLMSSMQMILSPA